MLEGYFIRRGFVQLSLAQLRTLPAEYVGKLYVALLEWDKIAEEKRKEASRG